MNRNEKRYMPIVQFLTRGNFLDQVAEPCEVIRLMENHTEQPNLNEPDPFVVIETSGTVSSLCLYF